MDSDFRFLDYHKDSSNKEGAVGLNDDSWPEEWLRIYFKSYPRFEEIPLPHPFHRSGQSLSDIMRARTSSRDFAVGNPITIEELSSVLSGLMITGEFGDVNYGSRRPYPSAGARYPLETYILPLNVDGLENRVYHYSPRGHTLEKLWSFSPEEIGACFPSDSWCQESGAAIVMTACYRRAAVKYQERAYRFCALEAGHAAQNLCLLATAEGLASCPYGGYVDESLMRLLDVNPNEEIPLHVLFVGKGVSSGKV
jgi:SagB-type dehydrogenase family enzyme